MNLSRRDFVRLSTAGVAAGLYAGPTGLLGQPLRAEFRQLRRNVGIFIDRGGTIGWLVNLEGVIAVDSQFADSAERFLVELREVGGRPIHALINTHHHADHTSGNGVLRYVVRYLVAHERSLENQRRSAAERGVEAEQEYPDTTFADTWSISVGDENIRAKYYGPAHTNGDVAILFERANVVHLGDLVNNRGYPNIDAAAGGSVHGWIDVLEQIAGEYPADAMYVFGHSEGGHPVTGTTADLNRQRDYFTAVLEAATRGIGAGRSREEVAAMQSLPGFEDTGGTVARLGLALGIAYDELTARGATR